MDYPEVKPAFQMLQKVIVFALDEITLNSSEKQIYGRAREMCAMTGSHLD